jgi:hypothetical protein
VPPVTVPLSDPKPPTRRTPTTPPVIEPISEECRDCGARYIGTFCWECRAYIEHRAAGLERAGLSWRQATRVARAERRAFYKAPPSAAELAEGRERLVSRLPQNQEDGEL